MRKVLLSLFILILIAGICQAINYEWLTGCDQTIFGDNVCFWGQDTLTGPIRTNTTFCIIQDPVFFGHVIVSENDLIHDSGYNPIFLGPDPIYNAPPVEIPSSADHLRSMAQQGNRFFDCEPNTRAVVKITPGDVRVTWESAGLPANMNAPSDVWSYSTGHTVFYFNCPIRVSGIIGGTLILCSSGTVGLEDNIIYASSDSITGALAPNHPEKFALISEGDIKILNTWANGRNNSNGQGDNQTNPDSTDIVLNGFYFALGQSFTFEQQNVGDSGYVCEDCGCIPGEPGHHPPMCSAGPGDERGTARIWGGVTQRRRGYLHRSCCGGTGYRRYLRYDSSLAYWDVGLGFGETAVPDTLHFGDVPLDSTVWDTVHISTGAYSLGSIFAYPPFHALRVPPYYGGQFIVPVSFTPTQARTYASTLTVVSAFYVFHIPLHGRGITNGGPLFAEPSVYPNPFNVTTTFNFYLETPGHVTLDLYDITGRLTAQILDQDITSGPQHVSFNAGSLPSGVYFARLITPEIQKTTKLLLIK